MRLFLIFAIAAVSEASVQQKSASPQPQVHISSPADQAQVLAASSAHAAAGQAAAAAAHAASAAVTAAEIAAAAAKSAARAAGQASMAARMVNTNPSAQTTAVQPSTVVAPSAEPKLAASIVQQTQSLSHLVVADIAAEKAISRHNALPAQPPEGTVAAAIHAPRATNNIAFKSREDPFLSADHRGASTRRPWASFSYDFFWLLQLVTGLTFAMVVKALCVASNLLVQMSPFPQVRRWEMRGSTGEADSAPYVSIAFGGFQWCFYGLFAWLVTGRSGFLVLVDSNCLGAVLGVYYVRAFYYNCHNEHALASLQRYISGVSSLALLQVCSMIMLPPQRALFVTGLVSSFCSLVGATAVLVTVPTVVRLKDSRSIPGPYAIANFLCGIFWVLCGWLLDDPLVVIPNTFACCCSGASLALKFLYPSDILFSSCADKLSALERDLQPLKKVEFDGEELVDVTTESDESIPLKLEAVKNAICTFSKNIEEDISESDPAAVPCLVDEGADGTGGTA